MAECDSFRVCSLYISAKTQSARTIKSAENQFLGCSQGNFFCCCPCLGDLQNRLAGTQGVVLSVLRGFSEDGVEVLDDKG